MTTNNIRATLGLSASDLIEFFGRLDELCDATDELVALHGTEPGTVSTSTVTGTMERVAAAITAVREARA